MLTKETKTAVITQRGDRITYGQLRQQMEWCAGRYDSTVRNLGLIVCDNSYENLVIYLSCLRYKIPVILVGMQDKEKVQELSEMFPIVYMWVPQNNSCISDLKCVREYGQYSLYYNAEADVQKEAISDDLALMLPTSGSEGKSKLVMLSYENISHNTQSIIEALDIKCSDRAAVMLPLCYSYGLSVVHTHLAAGATLLMPESPMISSQFWHFLEREKVTSLAGVPSGYELMRKLRILEGHYDFSGLRILTQAGGALRIETQEYVLQQISKIRESIHFAVMYGQTEATARMCSFFLDEHKEKLGSVGRVIPGGKIWIEGDAPEGEICYEGGNVFLGYAETVNNFKERIISGKLYTGDIGYLDGDGYLYITGRKKRFAKVNGYRLGLDELQAELSQELGCEVICVSVWNEEKERVGVCLTDDSVSISTVEDIIMKNRKIAGSCLIKLLERFPCKENGKPDYESLQNICMVQDEIQ